MHRENSQNAGKGGKKTVKTKAKVPNGQFTKKMNSKETQDKRLEDIHRQGNTIYFFF